MPPFTAVMRTNPCLLGVFTIVLGIEPSEGLPFATPTTPCVGSATKEPANTTIETPSEYTFEVEIIQSFGEFPQNHGCLSLEDVLKEYQTDMGPA